MTNQAIPFPVSASVPAVPRGAAWPVDAVLALFELPFNDLLYRAQQVHREHFDAGDVELATLMSIKTGGCPEDCGYCPQAARYDTGVTAQKILPLEEVLVRAQAANPQLATARAEITASERSAELVRRSWYPDVTLGVTVYDEDGSNDRQFGGYEAMVSFDVPLQWGLRRAREQDARAKLAASRARRFGTSYPCSTQSDPGASSVSASQYPLP